MNQLPPQDKNPLLTTSERALIKPKSILAFAESSEERQLVTATTYRKVSQLSKDEMGKLVELLARWRFFVGIKNTTPEELILLSNFIHKEYGQLTLEDIDLAINLSIVGKLDVDAKCYSFSPQYAAFILNAYLDYKSIHLTRVMERKEKAEQMQMASIKPTAEEERATMIEILNIEYQTYKDSGVVQDSFSIIYNHLKKTGRLKFKKAEIDEAIAYGERMASEKAIKLTGNIRDYLTFHNDDKTTDDKERWVKKYARNYCVQKYFDTIDIHELTGSLQLSEFI